MVMSKSVERIYKVFYKNGTTYVLGVNNLEQHKDLQTIIGQLDYPAFLVKKGMVIAVNLAAKQRLIETGMSIRDMILPETRDMERPSITRA